MDSDDETEEEETDSLRHNTTTDLISALINTPSIYNQKNLTYSNYHSPPI